MAGSSYSSSERVSTELLPENLLQLRNVSAALPIGAGSQPWLASGMVQVAHGQDALRLCFDLAQDADADVFYQVVTNTRHPLDVEMQDAALSPPAARTVLAALQAAGSRLRSLQLRGSWLGRSTLKGLLQYGLQCTTLDLSACRNLRGKLVLGAHFPHLTSLVLDANPGIQNLTQASFPPLPSLTSLSLTGSGLSNLWTTCAALAPLTALRQLALQRCACCSSGTAPCTGGPAVMLPLRQRPPPLQWAAALANEDSFTLGDNSPASLPSLTDSDATPMAVETPEYQGAFPPENEVSAREEFRTPRLFLSRTLLDLNEALQEPPTDEGFFTPLQRAVSSMSTDFSDSGASSLTLGAPWDDSDAVDCSPGEAGPSLGSASGDEAELLRLNDRGTDAMEVGGEGSGAEQAWQADMAGGMGAGREAPGNEASMDDDETGGETERGQLGGNVEVSPICIQRLYRAFMLVHLPQLQVLDKRLVTPAERERAQTEYHDHYASTPPSVLPSQPVLRSMRQREVGSCGPRDVSSLALRRSLGGAVAKRSVWPAINALSSVATPLAEPFKKYRPRQFEYSPREPGLMVVGTLSGEVVVLNHETQRLVGRVHTAGAPHSVLGLSWLNTHPSKIIAGCDNGAIQMLDVDKMRASLLSAAKRQARAAPRALSPTAAIARNTAAATSWAMGAYDRDAITQTYAAFEQLTSVHVNCTDQVFLASGYSSHVGLYDINTGKRVQTFNELHREHINVLKFAHHSPHLFVTSSFDRDIKMWDLRLPALHPLYTTTSNAGNVMCCFSPDDAFLLSSAVDNEVRQHCASDGRPHLTFDLAPTGSTHNYTRSYYMNGRDIVITGSCEENVVRVCCARTGRRLRDVTLEGRAMKGSLYVQSLRGDPFRDYHCSVLAAYNTPNARSEIIKVNLLSRGEAKTGRIRMEFDDDAALGA